MERLPERGGNARVALATGEAYRFPSSPARAAWILGLCLVVALTHLPVYAQSNVPREATWVTNGRVHAIAPTPSTIYIGGDFTYVGPNTGYGALIDTTSGIPAPHFAKVNGEILACAADGSGGWYIGGRFWKVGDLARNKLAHIFADGSVDALWDPNAYSNDYIARVHTLAVSGGVVYVGGNFSQIGGQARNNLAAIDVNTGLATAWDPNASGVDQPVNEEAYVQALSVSGNLVYAGGWFTSIGGQARNHIAALDATTGLATAWNPDARGTYGAVTTLVVSGSAVYAGGRFTSIGGQARNNTAALDLNTGLATAWDPNANGEVYSLAVSGGTVYAGGDFTSVGGQTRNHIAAVDAAAGTVTSWNPDAGAVVSPDVGPVVYSLAVSEGKVYVGGWFTAAGNQSRRNLAALDITTGLATAWDPGASDHVHVVAVSGAALYAGGNFTSVGGKTRNHLAALNAATGTATAWDPNLAMDGYSHGAYVLDVAVSGSTLYFAGQFTSVGGQPRNHLGAVDVATGAPTAWNPNADDIATGVTPSGGVVYARGVFHYVGGKPRIQSVALDATTGVATSWNLVLDCLPIAVVASGNLLYVGGEFRYIFSGSASIDRKHIAALDAATGLPTAWDPKVEGDTGATAVGALALSGTTLYAGGFFSSVGGQTRSCLAALDTTTGLATAWNPAIGGLPFTGVSTLALSGSTLYAGGSFSTVGGLPHNYIAAIDTATGLPTAWDPHMDGGVEKLAVNGGTVYATGGFKTIGGQFRPYLAQFDASPAVVSVTHAGATTTNASSVEYTVTFSVPVSGVDVGDFALTIAGGISGAAVTSVMGTGATYTVAVNSGVGDGTIRLDVVDNDTIMNEDSSLPLGGAGPDNGAFTGGQVLTIDRSLPSVAMTSTAPPFTRVALIPVVVTFGEPVTGFVASDIVVGNATLSGFTGSGAVYTFSLTPTSAGAVTARVPGGAATDAGGNTNQPSETLTRTYDPMVPNPDIYGDGVVDAIDVQLVINKALGLEIDGDADVDHDGVVNAVDVQLVINFALGVG